MSYYQNKVLIIVGWQLIGVCVCVLYEGEQKRKMIIKASLNLN